MPAKHSIKFLLCSIYYYIDGQFENAVEVLKTALNLYEKSSDKYGEAKTLIVIGEIYMNVGKDIYAMNNFQKALILYEELKDLEGIAGCLDNMAWVYQLCDHETSLKYSHSPSGLSFPYPLWFSLIQ